MLTSSRARCFTVAGLTAFAFAAMAWASRQILGPTIVFDEMGYLGNARFLAGAGSGWDMPTAPRYSLGYPLVIAPVVRLVEDATAQWQAVLLVNAALIACMVPLGYLLGRRLFRASHWSALAGAAMAAAVPAVWSAGSAAVAENLVLPLVPATGLALLGTLGGRRLRSRLWFGPAVALLYAAHPRFTAVVVVAAVLLVLAGRSRQAPWSVVGANLALLAIGVAAAAAGNAAVAASRWDHVETLEGNPDDLRHLVTTLDGLRELALTGVGQAWYLVVGSLGLAVVGVVALARRAAGRVEHEEPAPDDAARWTAAFLLAAGAVVFASSIVFFAQNQFRADHYVYGRHNDSFTALWVLSATVALTGPSSVARRRLLIVGAIASALTLVLVLSRDPASLGHGYHSPFAVPALARVTEGQSGTGAYWKAGAIALVAIALLRLLPKRWTAVGLLAAAGWFVWSGSGGVDTNLTLSRSVYGSFEVPGVIDRLGVDAVDVDVTSIHGSWPSLSWAYLLPGVRHSTFDPRFGDSPSEDFVVAQPDDPVRMAAGDRIAYIDRSGITVYIGAPDGLALWARGDAAVRLADLGYVLPPGWPPVVPPEARHATVRVGGIPADGEVVVPAGGHVDLDVTVEHTGSGSPWPSRSNLAPPAQVKVVADIRPLGEGPLGGRSGAEIPSWMLPGDRAEVVARVIAVDRQLQPLPPGRYRVVIGVGQDEPEWVASSPGASFTMIVESASG